MATGDQDALGALFDELGGKVFGTVLRVLRDPAQAEEVTQEVMLEVWRRADTFTVQRGSAAGWIVTIAHRRAVDRVRSEQAARTRTERVGAREHQRAFDAVTEQVERREDHAVVTTALDQLTDPQRQVIDLAYYQGHTYREIAEQLGIPLGTVKTRMRQAIIRLREAMEVSR
jgi:RNA polymerase sigma-70 factor (ECF subfamily)